MFPIFFRSSKSSAPGSSPSDGTGESDTEKLKKTIAVKRAQVRQLEEQNKVRMDKGMNNGMEGKSIRSNAECSGMSEKARSPSAVVASGKNETAPAQVKFKIANKSKLTVRCSNLEIE